MTPTLPWWCSAILSYKGIGNTTENLSRNIPLTCRSKLTRAGINCQYASNNFAFNNGAGCPYPCNLSVEKSQSSSGAGVNQLGFPRFPGFYFPLLGQLHLYKQYMKHFKPLGVRITVFQRHKDHRQILYDYKYKQLSAYRTAFEWLKEADSQALACSKANLVHAFSNFSKSVRGERNGKVNFSKYYE